MAQAFLHAGEHRLLVAGLDIDHPVGMQPGLGERRREQVAAASCTTAPCRRCGRRCRRRTARPRRRRSRRRRRRRPHAGRRAPARLPAGGCRSPPRRTAARPGGHGSRPRSARCARAACRTQDEAAWSSEASAAQVMNVRYLFSLISTHVNWPWRDRLGCAPEFRAVWQGFQPHDDAGPPMPASGRTQAAIIPPSSLRGPVATIRSASGGSGRCRATASSTEPVSQASQASGVVSSTGIALAWIGRTTSLASQVRKANRRCSPSWRIGLRPPCPGPRPPDPGKREQRPVLGQGEPVRHLGLAVGVLAERRRRHEAAPLRLQPAAPVGAVQVTDIGDRPGAEIGWRGHAPPHHGQLARAVTGDMDHRRHLVGKDAGQRRQVAERVLHRPGEFPDRSLALGQRVEIAHAPFRRLKPRWGAAGSWERWWESTALRARGHPVRLRHPSVLRVRRRDHRQFPDRPLRAARQRRRGADIEPARVRYAGVLSGRSAQQQVPGSAARSSTPPCGHQV